MSADGIKTALLMGGVSPEREVSLISGGGVLAALKDAGISPLVLDPAEEPHWLGTLIENKVERVFNILHGGSGENGEVRGALNSAGIACTGSDVLGSALAMNKHITKLIWRALGIPTADWRVASGAQDAPSIAASLPPPWFVKPVAGGSSTHTAVARDEAALAAAISSAETEHCGVMVERLIEGGEYTLSVLDNRPLPIIKIVPAQPFYDYHAKYLSDETQFFCPADLPPEREQALAQLGMSAFAALQCMHWGRVDFMIDKSGEVFFLEVNTVPGMTSHSLVPLAAKTAGLDYGEAVLHILESAAAGGGYA